MNHSSATQLAKGQLAKENHNASLARNSQFINFPEPYAANKYKKT